MNKVKDKKLLNKLLDDYRKKFRVEESFSYHFDPRTHRLVLKYSVPTMVSKNGKLVVRMKPKTKYRPQINIDNWKRFFKGNTTMFTDDVKFVKNERTEAEQIRGSGDEYDFKYWVDSFLARRVGQTKTIKELSPHTIKQNKRHIGDYYEWCIRNEAKSGDIFNHIDYGSDWFKEYYTQRLTGEYTNPNTNKKWSENTIHIAFRNVRGFYNFIADNHSNKFPYDLLKKLKIPKAKNSRDMLNPTEFEKVLDFIVEKKEDDFWGKFILMLRLQLKTGMRVGELVNIRNRNIDEGNKQIKITGKGDKDRILNFNSDGDADIWNDIIDKKGKNLFLFYRTRVQFYPKQRKKIEVDVDVNKATTESYYTQRFRQMRMILGLRDIITSHSLRRYFITKFVMNTGNRDLVRQIVGHSSTRMTDYYVGNMIQPDTKTTIDIGV